MFKYSSKTLEKVWNFISNFWEELPSTSPNKKIEKFHKLEERFIVKFAKKYDKNIKILDLGCGTGRCLKVLRDNGFKKLFGIDISSKMLSKAKSKLSNSAILLKHDFRTKLPFETNYFDIILITGNTLTSGGLIESDIALKQAYRILKKNGFLIVGSYNAKFMTEDFVKRYYGNFPKELQFKRFDKKAKTVYFRVTFSHWVTKKELRKLIENSGFKVVSIQEKGIGLIALAKKSYINKIRS